jgi:hypothetical protein
VSFASADAVFVGTVSHDGYQSALERRLEPWRQRLGLPAAPISFNPFAVVVVERAWKGVQRSPVQLQHDDSNCRYPFQAGEQYLIYAYSGPDGLGTILCSGTGWIGYKVDDLAYLQTQPTVFVSQPATGWLWGVVGGSAGLVVCLLGLLILRRRRRGQLSSPSSEVLR